ncbi:OLC1v1034078C1 [Oldenlandia corymbosa var. corymbosa]|uniref:OLC1v1034078C1 n=1 Tax=Oldenlandia corymbosa var. corymbosa TaxID=529605 RepID=A0AAV1CSJ1_OLDCO|nr:OLC1v1034078C1 [Oldenlandia corymbosa var. corymbosa]
MQRKISAFFKPSAPPTSLKTTATFPGSENTISIVAAGGCEDPEISVTYTRRTKILERQGDEKLGESANIEEKNGVVVSDLELRKPQIVLNKKRNYAQFHLELGQSDFLLHTCKMCGFEYSKGDEVDEKVHKSFHQSYTQGIHFKGWRNERLVDLPSLNVGRILLVLGDDPAAHTAKVQEVVAMMEKELGDGWIYHQHCKVYLFVSTGRIRGCLVAEPIQKAYQASSRSLQQVSHFQNGKDRKEKAIVLQFGEVSFQRDRVRKKYSAEIQKKCDLNTGLILSEKEATPASCGIRAIWVTPSNRRKHIASSLLDAVRCSFSDKPILNRSELAFSQPTSVGEVLICNYVGGNSFLVYKTT